MQLFLASCADFEFDVFGLMFVKQKERKDTNFGCKMPAITQWHPDYYDFMVLTDKILIIENPGYYLLKYFSKKISTFQ